MLIRNETSYPRIPDPAIRRATRWVLRQFELEPGDVQLLRIRNRNDGCTSGHIHLAAAEITISSGRVLVDRDQYRERYAERYRALDLNDGMALVAIEAPWAVRRRLHGMMRTLAHEVAHRYLWIEGKGATRTGRIAASEPTTCWHDRWLMRRYEPQATELIDRFLGKRWLDRYGHGAQGPTRCT